MNEADALAHPWPLTGQIDFRWRRAVWMSVRPFYKQGHMPPFGLADLTRIFILRAWFPFITYRIVWFGREIIHGYIGWKPIPVAKDPAFMWRGLTAAQQAIAAGELFVQLSARGGYGSIS